MATKLYVGNLSFGTDSESLRGLFAQYGEVVSSQVISDRDTGRSRGFGFVELADADAAERAIQELDGRDFEGRNIKVNVARSREDGPRRSERW